MSRVFNTPQFRAMDNFKLIPGDWITFRIDRDGKEMTVGNPWAQLFNGKDVKDWVAKRTWSARPANRRGNHERQ